MVIVCRKPLFAAQMVCLMSGDITVKDFQSFEQELSVNVNFTDTHIFIDRECSILLKVGVAYQNGVRLNAC